MKMFRARIAIPLLASCVPLLNAQAKVDNYTIIETLNLNRTNNAGVSVGTSGFGGMLVKGDQISTFTVPGGNSSSPVLSDINDAGVIVGEYFTPTGATGFIRKNGVFTTLQVPGEGRTTPQGLNNGGTVVGTFQLAGQNRSEAFVFKNGDYTRVSIPGAIFVNLWDVNDAGEAVGEATTQISPTFQSFSFLYSNGIITPIPPNPAFDQTRVFSINNRGEMTGMLIKGQDQTGFVLKRGQYETFKIPGSLSFVPFGINDKGDITGTYFTFFTPNPGGSPPDIQFAGATFIRHPK